MSRFPDMTGSPALRPHQWFEEAIGKGWNYIRPGMTGRSMPSFSVSARLCFLSSRKWAVLPHPTSMRVQVLKS